MNRKNNCRYWALLLILMAWLPVAGQTKVYSFDAVIKKKSGDSLSCNIFTGYPVLKFNKNNELLVYRVKGGQPDSIPCLDIKQLKFNEEQVFLGDANHDGKVTMADAVSVANTVLGKPEDSFNGTAADVNFDNKISVSDATNVVNMVVKNNGGAAARESKIADESHE